MADPVGARWWLPPPAGQPGACRAVGPDREKDPVLLRLRPKGPPLLFEDEGLEMGESSLHTLTCGILLYGLGFHFQGRRGWRVFGNLNVYYSDTDPSAYVSPDVLVARPPRPLPDEVRSYRLGQDGPAPALVAEVLSFRTYQEGDLTGKPVLYASLGVDEYLLVDVTGELLAERLLLLRRQSDGSWLEERDPDGGLTSRLGFRVVLEADGQVRVVDSQTGKRYARPQEAQAAQDALAAEAGARKRAERKARAEAKARQEAEERLRAAEAELARLRGAEGGQAKGPGKRRRKP